VFFWYDVLAELRRGIAMPLHDHFRPPLTREYEWENFHGDWITMMVQRLNTFHLSENFLAKGRSHRGTEVEVDIATLERLAYNGAPTRRRDTDEGGVATLAKTWSPPQAAIMGAVEFAEEDLFEVQIHSEGLKLVGAVELVSLGNKDRPAKRRVFATKVASYLAQGVSVIVVDVVTTRLASLHAELIDVLELPERFNWDSPSHLSAIAYRMIQIEKEIRLEIWPYALKVGEPLPTLPLWLAADLVVPLELEPTYAATCKGLRIAQV
jgi:hypothetical protein